MSNREKLYMLSVLSGEKDEELLSTFLHLAARKIIQKVYPFNDSIDEVPDKYANTQIDIALYLYNKRGAEGETYHSENGINRSYENADVPESMLKYVVPFAEVF